MDGMILLRLLICCHICIFGECGEGGHAEGGDILNKALEEYRERIYGKRAAVLGFGISNRPLARTLAEWGASVTVFDKKEENALSDILPEYMEMGIEFILGEGYLNHISGFDFIFRTPGMRFDIPEISKAVAEGAELTSEIEVFMKLCPAFIYAVTGSDGKTTTTSLICEILKQDGYNCYLGGNIGTPLLDRVHEMRVDDRVVLELSSFQLHTMNSSPDVAVITNITPNHLDIHKSMEEYIDAKRNIFRHQSPYGRTVLNYDNPVTRSFIPEVRGLPVLFSSLEECSTGAFIRDNHIIYREKNEETDVLDIGGIKIPGMHNVQNYMAAISAVIPEASIGSIRYVAENFNGVEHRNEFVRCIKGVSFYNDSIGTSPTRTAASIKAHRGNVVLIAGGYDKNLSYDELGEVLHENAKALVLMGATAGKIEEAYRKFTEKKGLSPITIVRVSDMEAAVTEAFRIAGYGDAVLLSPASASFDMYPNFMEKGNHFKEIVGRLKA